MIVWIDGANGVGKSHVAAELEELLSDGNAEYVESDLYWYDALKHFPEMFLLGLNPCQNKYMIAKLRESLLEKIQDADKILFVSMTLADKICTAGLLDYFAGKGIPTLHIILLASRETLISRIKNDPIRDENTQKQQIDNLDWQLSYLENNYPDAARIDTENRSLDEIVGEIMALLEEN